MYKYGKSLYSIAKFVFIDLGYNDTSLISTIIFIIVLAVDIGEFYFNKKKRSIFFCYFSRQLCTFGVFFLVCVKKQLLVLVVTSTTIHLKYSLKKVL